MGREPIASEERDQHTPRRPARIRDRVRDGFAPTSDDDGVGVDGTDAPAGGPMTIISSSVWRPQPGHLAELTAALGEAKRIHERLGARVAAWEPVVGGPAGCVSYTTEFDDLAAWDTFADRLDADAEWREFWRAATTGDRPVVTVVDTVLVSELELR
jgi:hypothetical protein